MSSVFPFAKPTLCIFHIIQAVRRQLSKDDYDDLSVEQRDCVLATFKRLLYARSHEHLLLVEDELRRLSPIFWMYYSTNWRKHECWWALWYRRQLPLFLRWTNNGNEGLNYAAQIPCTVVKDLAGCVEIHLNDFNTAIDSANHEEDIGTVQTFGTMHLNHILNHILNATTSTFMSILMDEWSRKSSTEFVCSAVSYYCGCTFFSQFTAPCRHFKKLIAAGRFSLTVVKQHMQRWLKRKASDRTYPSPNEPYTGFIRPPLPDGCQATPLAPLDTDETELITDNPLSPLEEELLHGDACVAEIQSSPPHPSQTVQSEDESTDQCYEDT